MDSHFVILVLVTVISTVSSVKKQNGYPHQMQNLANVAVDNVGSLIYGNVPEQPETYFNPTNLYSPPDYGYENMVMRRAGNERFPMPFMHRHRPPYMRMPHHYRPRIPPPMAYWDSLPKRVHISTTPLVTPSTTSTTTPSTTPSTIPPTTTTRMATTITATSVEPIHEETTRVEEIVTTEPPKQQKEEPGEDLKQRKLPTIQSNNNCGPDEQPTEAPTTEINEEPPVTTAVPEPVSVPAATTSTEVPVPLDEKEAIPAISYRRSGLPVPPEMALPSMYPEKTLFNPAYPPMPYLPAMDMDPYAAFNRLNVPQLYPGRFYGY